MQYTMGEMAEIAGISKSAIRNYEAHGLLKPLRNDANHYRSYTETDLFTLQLIMFYRELGFPVDEIRKLIGGYSEKNLAETYRKRRLKMEEEMEHLLSQIRKLEHMESDMYAIDKLGVVRETIMPDFLWVANEAENRKELRMLSGMLPESFVMIMHDPEQDIGNRMGWGIRKRVFLSYCSDIPDKMTEAHGGKALSVVISGSDLMKEIEPNRKMLAAEAQKRNLKIFPQLFLEGISTIKDEQGVHQYYGILWQRTAP